MADDKQGGTGFGGNGLILLAVAAASALYVAWQKPPLEGSRPSEANYRVHLSTGAQNVDARMWQDPFAAVDARLENGQKDKSNADDQSLRREARQLAELLKDIGEGETLVIGVTLPGAPYEEDTEERRRLRYAVLAALHTEKFLPEDEEHIGYVATADGQTKGQEPRPDTVIASSAGSLEAYLRPNEHLPPLPPIIPFERFDGTGEPAKHVVVLWLDESVLASGGRPVGSLLRLRDELRLPATAKFVLIGPHESTTLAAMAAEFGPGKRQDRSSTVPDANRSAPRLPVYNFAATADDRTVLRLAQSSMASLEQYFAAKGVDYYRTVNSDEALAGGLVNELKRHDVDPYRAIRLNNHGTIMETRDGRDHIALISEWDTVYGQTLPEAMKRAFAEDASIRPGGASDAAQILHFAYLRGLDGQLPQARSAKAGKSSGESGHSQHGGVQSSASAGNTTGTLEKAEGQGQFDYLRRLADHVRQRDDELRQTGEGRIAAIGVLGSDVYDKLLILQALRPEFPEAQFFTTDLDALLLQRGEFGYTRNLIVASSYDLKLCDAAQADIPPFRSTYQTSAFLTTRLAVENELNDADASPAPDKTRETLKKWLAQPRLFQIGRTGAFPLPATVDDLPRHESADAARSCAGSIVDCPSIQPPSQKLFPEVRSGSFVSVSLLMASVMLAVPLGSRRVRQTCFPRAARGIGRRLAPLAILLAIILAGSFGLCAYWPSIAGWLTQYGMGEPIVLFEGISVWPTIILRAVGFGLCIWLICRTLHELELNIRNTEKEMQLRRPRLSILRRPYIRLRGRSVARRLFDVVSPPNLQRSPERSGFPDENQRPSMPILRLSVRYSYEGRAAPRLMRAAIGTLAMILLWLVLAPIFGQPNTPARGDLAFYLYRGVTSLDVVATLFLTFLVADATLYSRSFVKQLTAVRSEWPARTVEHFARTLGLRGENLDDWIDMQFLAKRTQCITSLIYYPFLMIALLVVSRSRVFDDFTTPATLVITQAISVAVVIGSVVALRLAAEKARGCATEHLTAKIIVAKGAEQLDVKVASQLEMMLARVENLRSGAFAPLSSQPFVKALLLPLLSYGGTVLVHMYALPGF